MSISNYLEEKILNKIFSDTNFTVSTVYISLHTGDPGETGASEATGGSYIRQLASFDAASNPAGTVQNSAIIDFTSMPSTTITHIGMWDDESAGNFLWGGSFTASKVVNSGDTYRIPAAALTVTLS